jgi:hypothetical protein
MTGFEADKCGTGEPAFKIEILDESVVEYGGHPPDAPSGLDTFKGTNEGGSPSCVGVEGAAGTGVGETAVNATGAISNSGDGLTVSASSNSTDPAGSAVVASSKVSSAVDSLVGASAAVSSSWVGATSVPGVQPAQSSAIASSVDPSDYTAAALSTTSAVSAVAPVLCSSTTSQAAQEATSLRGGYRGDVRGSRTRG